jgi:hypothetical protein
MVEPCLFYLLYTELSSVNPAQQGNSNVAGWKRRFFVLYPADEDQYAVLSYYTDEKCDELHDSVILYDSHKTVPVGTHQLAVLANQNEYILRCFDSTERET